MRIRAAALTLMPLLALTSCAAAPQVDLTTVPKAVQSPLTDDGAPAQRAAVRTALIAALGAQEDQLSRTASGAPRSTPVERRTRLDAVETDALADSDLRAMDSITDSDIPFRSATFSATRWQGVVVEGDRAKAYVLGHVVEHRWDGTEHAYPEFQYKALLRRSDAAPHGWRLTLVRAASDEQG